jgi:hypothetical protein
MHKKFDGVFAYCEKRRLPEVDDACCVFDDCELFKECHSDEWVKLQIEKKQERR